MRTNKNKYPDYTAEIEALENDGFSIELLRRIITKHRENSTYNKKLIDRYEVLADGVPIFDRKPRFDSAKAINNHLNNDHFSEIVDFKTGYFAGNPIAYSYSHAEESKGDTGDVGDSEAEQDAAVEAATKALTDFVTRSNMFDVDMECTKFAAICGYSGRLFYIDKNGDERVMVVPPNECIILSKTRDITQPTFGVRYYTVTDIHDNTVYKAEFYNDDTIYYAEGGSVDALEVKKEAPNLFDCCPLQGIPNNREMMGDAEKVLSLIDAFDRSMSDANNELESFAHAYMVFKNLYVEEKEKEEAQFSGSIEFQSNGQTDSDVYFLTKNINDGFIEHHLDRIEKGIYKYSKTPNLSDETFGTASGIALRFKLTGLEAKCGTFEAKMISAGTYMFALLANVWAKNKQIKVDPLQCTMSFKRNFPLDLVSEAQAAQAMIAAGVPKRVAFEMAFSGIDDIEYVMQLVEEEKESIPGYPDDNDDDDDNEDTDQPDDREE